MKKIIVILACLLALSACGDSKEKAAPETSNTYTKSLQQQERATDKYFLSGDYVKKKHKRY